MSARKISRRRGFSVRRHHTEVAMMDGRSVLKHFDLSARTVPQLELRLYWFGRALAARQGHIVAVERRKGSFGRHVASIDYEVPVPTFVRPRKRRSGVRMRALGDRIASG